MGIAGLTELSPCWRPLLKALTAHISVKWMGTGVTVARAAAQTPEISAASVVMAYREAIEARRWAREACSPRVCRAQIAIVIASPGDYDDYFLTPCAGTSIDRHFVRGVRTVTTCEGQAAAALADIVVRGLSQSPLYRLVALCRRTGSFESLAARTTDRCAALDTGCLEPSVRSPDARRLARWRRSGPGAARRRIANP